MGGEMARERVKATHLHTTYMHTHLRTTGRARRHASAATRQAHVILHQRCCGSQHPRRSSSRYLVRSLAAPPETPAVPVHLAAHVPRLRARVYSRSARQADGRLDGWKDRRARTRSLFSSLMLHIKTGPGNGQEHECWYSRTCSESAQTQTGQ